MGDTAVIERITADLPFVDKDELAKSIAEFGVMPTVLKWGRKLESYQNNKAAGRLYLHYVEDKFAKSTHDYVKRLSHRLSQPIRDFFLLHAEVIDKEISKYQHNNDKVDLMAAGAFIKTYLAKERSKQFPVESIQYLWMRVSVQKYYQHGIDKVLEDYRNQSNGYYLHASPTLLNAGMMKISYIPCNECEKCVSTKVTNRHPDWCDSPISVEDPRNQMSSCFLMTIADDTESILSVARSAGLISKNKGGIGIDVARIRHSEIGDTGYSKGLIPLLYLYNALIRYFDQEGLRNGACNMYTRAHHIDIYDFCEASLKTGDHYMRTHHLNTTVWMPWLFWKREENDEMWTLFCPNKTRDLNDIWGVEFIKRYEQYELEFVGNKKYEKYYKQVKARDLLKHIIKCQMKSGMPYLMNGDSCNMKSNQKNLGYIRSSNLCVAPETPVFTDNGWQPIASLKDKQVNVWNGTCFSSVKVVQTGSQQKLVNVHLSNGLWVTCTPYHKFLVVPKNYDAARKLNYKTCPRVDASQLQKGDRLIKFDTPVVQGNPALDFKYAYTHGFFTGDGTYQTYTSGNRYAYLALYGDKIGLLDKLDYISTGDVHLAKAGGVDKLNLTLPRDLEEKYKVPLGSSVKCRLEWFAGLMDADGTVCRNGTTYSLQIRSTEQHFLYSVQMMLMTLGVQSKVNMVFAGGLNMLPDGKGGSKLYDCNPQWRLLISSFYLHVLLDMGWTPHRLDTNGITRPNRNAFQFITVEAVVNIDRVDDTYCFEEPINNTGVFNGVLTGQCLEIIEFSSEDEIPSCNLAQMSPKAFVKGKTGDLTVDFDWQNHCKAVRDVVSALNRVIEENYCPLDEIKTSNEKHRPLGIGLSGFADALYLLDLHFEHPQTRVFNKMYFGSMHFNTKAQSIQEAILHGKYESFDTSPAAQGKLQFDLWAEEYDLLKENNLLGKKPLSKPEDNVPLNPSVWNQQPITLFDTQGTPIDTIEPTWSDLKRCIMTYGLRNSLDIALMPSASTSTIAMNTETVEAPMTNIFERRLMNGNYPVLNQYMEMDLREIGAWTDRTIQLIDADTGSISKLSAFIKEFPQWYPDFDQENVNSWNRLQFLQTKYKTMWELSTRTFIDLAAERGIHIDQSASSNNYMKHPTYKKMRAAHVISAKKRVKTIQYYLRQEPARPNSKITVDPRILTFVEKIDVSIEPVKLKNKTTGKTVHVKPKEKTEETTTSAVISEDEISVSELTFEASTKGKPVGSRFICADGSCCE